MKTCSEQNTIWVGIYHDTIEDFDGDDNTAYICVTKTFAEQYYEECIRPQWDYGSFEDFYDEYTSDDTLDFYDYAVKHNAIIDIDKDFN